MLRTTAWKYGSHGFRGKRKQRARRQKRGKRAGLIAKVKAGACRPPIPSHFLSNVRTLDNKMDLLRLRLGQEELHDAINALQNKCPEALYVVAEDFSHAFLRDTLPTFQQHVNTATQGNNTLDKVYTNRRGTYRAFPHPHFGSSDHISVMLAHAYCPEKDIPVWPS